MTRKARDIRERFLEKVEVVEGGCHLWLGSINSDGYGTFSINHSRSDNAHRVAYELFVGPIPEGHQVDHVKARGCKHRHCVNPEHLEAVTASENVRRQRGNLCKNGHPFDRVRLRPDGTIKQRICSICGGNRGIRPDQMSRGSYD